MSTVSRREFAALVTGTVAGLTGGDLTAPVQAQAPMSTETPAPEDLQLALLKLRYPAPHLTPEMYAGIREGLTHNQSLADQIRRVPLTHDIPPATVFQVLRPTRTQNP